jgi:LPS-assembly lipoprotein
MPAPSPATVRRLLLALPALALAGCGFQLRGSADLPFRTLFAAFPPGSTTATEFARMLRGGGTRLVDRPQDAEARLDVLEERREKEIVGFSGTGRPREYQIRLLFTFRVVDAQETELVPPTQLILRRDITTTDTQYVAKEQEEALLYRDMQRDLVQQLLRRLAAARR